ncbi:MAG: hypothetical protein WCY05_03165 [Candidatus Omnitrophota bacterium]
MSHYTVFKKIKGFRWLEFGKYAFDIVTEEGKIISFDVSTGNIRSQEDEKNQKKKDKEYQELLCKTMKGTLIHCLNEDGNDVWSCESSGDRHP